MNDLFSERYGYVVRVLQYENLDKVVRAHLWDEVNHYFLSKALRMYTEHDDEYEEDPECAMYAFDFYYSIHRDFWGQSVDEFPENPSGQNDGLKNIMMNSKWFHAFDIMEAIVRTCPKLFPNLKKRKAILKNFHKAINKVFEEQKCAYRIASDLIIPNINNAEIITIANALVDTESIITVNIHLDQAVKHYSNRGNPDYRNSIKESILALESLLKIIVGSKNGTMADALKQIKKNNTLELHQALQDSLKSLYGWAGDESGVRHHLKGELSIDSDDAKLIIVTCCSLVSFLTSKAIKSGISFEKKG